MSIFSKYDGIPFEKTKQEFLKRLKNLKGSDHYNFLKRTFASGEYKDEKENSLGENLNVLHLELMNVVETYERIEEWFKRN